MHTVIHPAERAVLEEKLRSVLGGGAATSALLKLLDAVNDNLAPYTEITELQCNNETATDSEVSEPAPEVQVVESSP